jgi:hypothetical protein
LATPIDLTDRRLLAYLGSLRARRDDLEAVQDGTSRDDERHRHATDELRRLAVEIARLESLARERGLIA